MLHSTCASSPVLHHRHRHHRHRHRRQRHELWRSKDLVPDNWDGSVGMDRFYCHMMENSGKTLGICVPLENQPHLELIGNGVPPFSKLTEFNINPSSTITLRPRFFSNSVGTKTIHHALKGKIRPKFFFWDRISGGKGFLWYLYDMYFWLMHDTFFWHKHLHRQFNHSNM